MASKLLFLVLFAAALAAALLCLRQHQLEMVHEMALIHHRMDQSRQGLWDWQTRIAQQMEPRNLKEAIVRAKLELEPVTPIPKAPDAKDAKPRLVADVRASMD